MKTYLSFLWSNRYTLGLVAVLVLAAGWVGFVTLPRSVFPDVNFPRVTVLVTNGYMPVNLMLLQVTQPLEQAAKGTQDVTLVRSQTGNGLSKLHVYFGPQVNPNQAFLMLQARLAQVPLPAGSKIRVRPMMPNIFPFAEYALVSDTRTSSQMMPLFAFKVRPALLDVNGVYTVQGIGRGWPQIEVRLDPRRMAQYQLSGARVAEVLRGLQGPYYAGQLYGYHQQFLLVTQSRPATLEALRQAPIPVGPPNAPQHDRLITLGDLGTVSQTAPPWIRDAAVANYRHALLVDVAAQAGVNVQAVAAQVAHSVAQLRASLPPGVKLVKVYDFSDLVRSSLSDVWTALLLGTAITWGVLLLFLRRLDTALATLVIVPLSMGATLVVLKALGFGLNIMTLGGITAAIGALVDHAIVVIEHAMKRSMRGAADTKRASALAACGDILPVMTLATVTSALVFVPLVFLSGTLGILFRQMALALVVALVISQLVALTLTPVLSAWLAQRYRSSGKKGWRWARRMRVQYDHALRAGLHRPWLAVPVMAVAVLLAGLAWRQLPTAFLPSWDEGAIAVPFRAPTGSSV
ncbi:MAG: efflux RND transporter permease subunit, partial [Gammaproteobacteria bacterium]|nr:efflux RND transporter permease subunit [Gammaproteobacteria bacterium]